MSLLDDAIGVFSPGWKAARLQARAKIRHMKPLPRPERIRGAVKTVLQISSAKWGPYHCGSRPGGSITTTIW